MFTSSPNSGLLAPPSERLEAGKVGAPGNSGFVPGCCGGLGLGAGAVPRVPRCRHCPAGPGREEDPSVWAKGPKGAGAASAPGCLQDSGCSGDAAGKCGAGGALAGARRGSRRGPEAEAERHRPKVTARDFTDLGVGCAAGTFSGAKVRVRGQGRPEAAPRWPHVGPAQAPAREGRRRISELSP